MRGRTMWSLVLAALLATGASAHEITGTCAVSSMRQDFLAPASLSFPFTLGGSESVPVTIDVDAGTIVADFTQLPLIMFHNGFSSDSEVDTFHTTGGPVTGTIDAEGHVLLPGVTAVNCTQGNCPMGAPCPCVPGNVCSNDTDRVCVVGTSLPDLMCEGGGTCQGVCSDDRTKSCAGDADCAPTGFCGQGLAMRFDADLTTGVGSYGDESKVGVPLDFTTGTMTLVDVMQTAPETFAIGDTGINSFAMTCTLDQIPLAADLPPGPTWAVKKGKVKLGKEGPDGIDDDKLSLKGTLDPAGTVPDFDANDLVLRFDDGTTPIMSLRVPAGSMTANKKGTKLTLKDKTGAVVEVAPPRDPGAVSKHIVKIARKKDGSYFVKVASKGLALDGLDVAQLTTRVVVDVQSPSDTEAVSVNKKGNKLTF